MSISALNISNGIIPIVSTEQDIVQSLVRAKNSFESRRYYEARDILALLLLSGKEKPELRVEKALLELRCHMALSNLEQAHYAWQDLEGIFAAHPHLNTVEIALVAVRLHWAHGDATAAEHHIKQARSLARNSKDLIHVQAWRAKLAYFLRGDSRSISEELLPVWTALGADKNFSQGLDVAAKQLRLSLIFAIFSQGNIRLARELTTKIEVLDSVLKLELLALEGLVHALSGERSLAIRAAQDIDLAQLRDGSSRQERATLLWWQSLIYYSLEMEREAQAKAEELREMLGALSTPSQPSEFKPYADIMLAACLIQRKSYVRAQQLLSSYGNGHLNLPSGETIDLSLPLKTMLVLCDALILHESEGVQAAAIFLQENEGKVFCRDSLLFVSLMCYAHKSLFALLCEGFSLEQFPIGLTDLLDLMAFQEKYESALEQADEVEKGIFNKRFKVLTDVEVQSVERQEPLQIRLFAGLDLNVAGQPLNLKGWGRSKTRSLFICMALKAGSELAREAIMDRLWPELDAERARNIYNVTWCQMRKKIIDVLPSKSSGEADYIYNSFQNSGGRCILNKEGVYVDVHEFDHLATQLNGFMYSGDKTACLSTIKKMAEIYRGDLLPGDCYCDWLDVERQHYRRVFLDAMLAAAHISLEIEEPESALFYLHRASLLQSESEELHYLSMKAYAATGRREDAISAYLSCKHYLSNEFGLDPSQRTNDLYQELLCEGI
jgi:DNA-binding SARP family transcriptional activator